MRLREVEFEFDLERDELFLDGAILTSYLQRRCKKGIRKKEKHCQVLLNCLVNLPLKWGC